MNKSTERRLFNLEKRLVRKKRLKPLAEDGWAKNITGNAGVYVLWSNKTREPIYVGETSCLNQRMSDIGRTVNHTFRRIIAGIRRWTLLDDNQLSFRISREFDLSFIELHLGRAELEEYLIIRWREFLVNKKDKRVRRGDWYEKVQPIRKKNWKTEAKKHYGCV